MKSEDQFKYFEGGEDGADVDERKVDADAALSTDQFEKKKTEQRQTIRCNLLKWLAVFGLICILSYYIMLAKNPYRTEDSIDNENGTPAQ